MSRNASREGKLYSEMLVNNNVVAEPGIHGLRFWKILRQIFERAPCTMQLDASFKNIPTS